MNTPKRKGTRAELAETLAMAVYMGGGPSLMYAARTSAAFGSAAGVSSMPGKGSKGCCSCSNRCSAWS